jgi:hypothetical protein
MSKELWAFEREEVCRLTEVLELLPVLVDWLRTVTSRSVLLLPFEVVRCKEPLEGRGMASPFTVSFVVA